MSYPLKNLLRIRELRKQSAMSRTQHARIKLEEAKIDFDSWKQKLVEYHGAMLERERILLDNAKKEKITFAAFANIQDELSSMKSYETQYRNAVSHAQIRVQDKKKELERLKAEFYQIAKEKQKLDEHYLIWSEVEKMNCEKALDEDLDELAIRYSI